MKKVVLLVLAVLRSETKMVLISAAEFLIEVV